MEENDPNRLREVEIRRLVEMAELAYRNAMDPGLKMKTRESWHGKYTNAVLALNVLLRDARYQVYEKRMREIEQYEREERGE